MSDDTLRGPPGPRAIQALFKLIPILQAAGLDGAVASVDSVINDVAVLNDYVRVQEENLRELRDSALDAHREVNRLNALIPAAMREAELEQAVAATGVEVACQTFNDARGRCEALRKESLRDFTIPLQPRSAAREA